MIGYLIDPFTQTINIVEHNDTIEDIHRLIGADGFDSALITEYRDAVFVDEYGLVKEPSLPRFGIRGYHEFLAGKGLIVGINLRGETTEPNIPFFELCSRVIFLIPT